MERLTKYEPCEGGIPLVTVEDEQSALQRLAAYEDTEEQGLLVRLPCKVGDTVYVPDEENNATRDIEVSYYNVEDNSIVAVCTFDCTNYGCPCVFADWRWDGEESACSAYGCFVFEPKDIGKTVFLTREEAEAALAKEREP